MRTVSQPVLHAVRSTSNPLQIQIGIGDDESSQQLSSALRLALKQCDTHVDSRCLPQSAHAALSVSLPHRQMGGAATFYRFRALAPLRKAHAVQLDVTIVTDDSGHLSEDHNARINPASISEQSIDLACRYAVQRGRQRLSLLTHIDMSPATQSSIQRMTEKYSARYQTLTLDTLSADEAMFAMFKDGAALDMILTTPAMAQTLCAAAVNLTNSADTATIAQVRDGQCRVSPWRSAYAGETPAGLSAWLQCATECLLMLGRAQAALKLDNAWLATLEHGAHCSSVQLISPYTTTLAAKDFASAVCARLGETPRKVTQRLAPATTAQTQPLTLVANTH